MTPKTPDMPDEIKPPEKVVTSFLTDKQELSYYDAFLRGGSIWFRIGVQSFRLAGEFGEGDEKQAEWMLGQFKKALCNLTDHMICTPPKADLAPAQKWQTMESAPRDGTRIIISLPKCVTEAKFGEYRYRENTFTGWHFYDSEDPWFSVGFEDDGEPTHWQPLPPPPSARDG